jgi:hypothetical protein
MESATADGSICDRISLSLAIYLESIAYKKHIQSPEKYENRSMIKLQNSMPRTGKESRAQTATFSGGSRATAFRVVKKSNSHRKQDAGFKQAMSTLQQRSMNVTPCASSPTSPTTPPLGVRMQHPRHLQIPDDTNHVSLNRYSPFLPPPHPPHPSLLHSHLLHPVYLPPPP